MPAQTLPFHLTIGSRFENIELVQAVLSDALSAYDMDEESRHWVDLAVREAVANAIQHGNRLAPDKRVEIDLELSGRELVVRVRDQGEGFDPGSLIDPLAPENRLRPNGRGIFYMQKFMDEIDYDFQPGRGTEVTLRKRLGTGSEDPAGTAGSSEEGSR
ncbi:MAG TPA: ATP-binding protein [Thermoanaerobaculia bacterium]|nr:ATP-binding protein [Thermoanaerobaculia bacterium]